MNDGLPGDGRGARTNTISLTDEKPTLSPEWLREVAENPDAVFLVVEPKISMLADALEIADSSARSDIECFCLRVDEDDTHWYSLRSATDDDRQWTEIGARYLDARGLLVKHPTREGLVRFQEASDA